jgi:flagellar hook assembly protein FlgD
MNLIKGKCNIMRIGFFILLLSSVILAQPVQQSALVTVDDDSDLVTILKADVADPFRNEAKICFKLGDTVHVSVKIVTPQGETIRELLSAELADGQHTLSWDGKDDNGEITSSGVFVYEIHARQVKRSAMLALLN